jgi:23S rRNA pseudouridine2605 synthase
MPDPDSMRIAKYLAAAGLGSRRACERIVADGEVSVNGEVLDSPARNVVPGVDEVRVRGRLVAPDKHVYVALNKPVGYTCSQRDDYAEHLVYELLPESLGRLFTIGRLDRDSEGLILLTNDGDFGQALSHPSRGVEKVYHVDCRGLLTDEVRRQLLVGVRDQGELLKPLDVRVLEQRGRSCRVEFRLGEGRKREVRRLCSFAHLGVVRLVRVSIGALKLGTMESGKWRHLTGREVADMLASAGGKSGPRRDEKGRDRLE